MGSAVDEGRDSKPALERRVKTVTGALLLLASFSASEVTQAEDVEVDWVQNYEDSQNEASFDYLLNCWAKQWPEGVKARENAPPARLATERDISAAIVATRKNCGVEMNVRVDQINVDLARKGVEPPEIHVMAQRQLEADLNDMFAEYWSRL